MDKWNVSFASLTSPVTIDIVVEAKGYEDSKQVGVKQLGIYVKEPSDFAINDSQLMEVDGKAPECNVPVVDKEKTNLTLLQAIEIAKESCKNSAALTYLNAIEEARCLYGESGVKSQINYILCNMSGWKGEIAREVKKTFKEYVNG